MQKFSALLCCFSLLSSEAALAMQWPFACSFLSRRHEENQVKNPDFYETLTDRAFKDLLVKFEERLKNIKSNVRGASELAYLTELNVRMVDLVRHDIKNNDISDIISTMNPTFLNVEFGFAFVTEGRKIQRSSDTLLKRNKGKAETEWSERDQSSLRNRIEQLEEIMKVSGTPETAAGLQKLMAEHRRQMFQEKVKFGEHYEFYRKFRSYVENKRIPILDRLIKVAEKRVEQDPSQANKDFLESLRVEEQLLPKLMRDSLGWPTISGLAVIKGERPPMEAIAEFFEGSKPAQLAQMRLMLQKERAGIAKMLASHTANDRRWSPLIAKLPKWVPYRERAHRWGCYKIYFQEMDRLFPYSREPRSPRAQLDTLQSAHAKFGEPMLMAYFRLKVSAPYREKVLELAKEQDANFYEALKRAQDTVINNKWGELSRSPERSNSNTALISMLLVGITLSAGSAYLTSDYWAGSDDDELLLTPEELADEEVTDALFESFQADVVAAQAGDAEAARRVGEFAKFSQAVADTMTPEEIAKDLDKVRELAGNLAKE